MPTTLTLIGFAGLLVAAYLAGREKGYVLRGEHEREWRNDQRRKQSALRHEYRQQIAELPGPPVRVLHGYPLNRL